MANVVIAMYRLRLIQKENQRYIGATYCLLVSRSVLSVLRKLKFHPQTYSLYNAD